MTIEKEDLRGLKVAIVCDWLTNVGGAEKVILEIHKMFPDAPIYTSQYRPKKIDWFQDADVRTGWLQKFPVKLRRFLGPLRQIYFSKLDLSEYDLVISVTGAEAKAVQAKNGVHISYCHVPTQYYWQMYDEYIKNPGFGILNPIVRLFFRLLVLPLRYADLAAAKRPDYFVTISEYAKEQIKKYYGREAVVVHPPVELEDFRLEGKQSTIRLKDGCPLSDAYVITSRQVNWKHVELAVRAAFLSQRHVVVIGEGPEHRKLVKMAKGSDLVRFLPLMTKEKLARYLSQARGFLFPSLEPFGIAPVEALAAGCPVVAYDQGGARDYIKDGVNGVLFSEQTPIALAEGMLELEKMRLNREEVAKTVEDYGLERFDRELLDAIENCGIFEKFAKKIQKRPRGNWKRIVKKEEDARRKREEAAEGKGEIEKKEQKIEEKEEKIGEKKGNVAKTVNEGKRVESTRAVAKVEKRSRNVVKVEKTEKPVKVEKPGKPVKVEKPGKLMKIERPMEPVAEKPVKLEGFERSMKLERPEKVTKVKRPERTGRGFPIIREDLVRTKELVKQAEAIKEANKPKFPKIGG